MRKFILLVSLMAFTFSVSAQLKELNQKELYEKVLNIYDDGDYTYKDNKPCVVLFFSPYCEYSKIMERNIAAVAPKFNREINFYKVNVFKIDNYTMESLEIPGTPATLIMFSDGEYEVEGGVATTHEIKEMLEMLLDD